MTQGKIVAIITGAISLFIAVIYLILVQILDFRGEMIPAPIFDSSSVNYAIAITPSPNHISSWLEQ